MPASSLPDSSNQAAVKRSTSSGFETLHIFTGVPDGAVPVGSLLLLNGVLYSTTNFGGNRESYCSPGDGCGLIYQVASGQESVTYRFASQANGLRPYAGLTNVNGTLYGTTQIGGANNDGTVFAFSPGTSGSESVVYSFGGTPDGQYPRAQLTNVSGVLYGTTYQGGASGVGTVFSVTTGGAEQIVYGFKGGSDGAQPLGNVIDVNGTFYGTTLLGGGPKNKGTVYAINASGESVLHSFTGKPDGSEPFAGLIDVNGTLYGTTELGGKYGKGTIFTITSGGQYSVIYNFEGEPDSANPYAGLTLLNGQLYGVASHGGTNNDGTIYTISPSGSEAVLFSFDGTDGAHPYADLTASDYSSGGTLYGTTNSGGPYSKGTVFQFTP